MKYRRTEAMRCKYCGGPACAVTEVRSGTGVTSYGACYRHRHKGVNAEAAASPHVNRAIGEWGRELRKIAGL